MKPTIASALRLAVLLAVLAPLPASAQFAILYTWPGAFPCNATLQACIDAAGSEDTASASLRWVRLTRSCASRASR